MSYGGHHHHGRVQVGRAVVMVACVLVLAVNGLIYKQAAAPPHPLPALQVAAVISLIWMVSGAVGLCLRKSWGRALVLTILYAGAFGFFVAAIISLAAADQQSGLGLKTIFLGIAIYLIVSLVLTHSKHVHRLTSRTWE